MDIKSSAGRTVKTLKGYGAFLPNPLPPRITWDSSLINSLSRADHLLGKLSREGSSLPNPHLFVRPFITREAVLSSKIEGTQATLGEILAAGGGMPVDRSPDDLKEVHNYIAALDYGLKRMGDMPLSLRLICEVHEQLMQGVRGSHATPGEFRRSQNWIGAPGSTLMSAKYVPPAPENLMDILGAFEIFLYDRTLPSLIHVALCHYQFEAIHPFLDGNGRVGRLLIILLLMEHKVLSAPLLYISAFFEATRDDYYRHLYRVSAEGEWSDWLTYFLNGIAAQSVDVLSRTERINNQLSLWQGQAGGSGAASEVVRYLAVNPYLTTTKVADHLAIAFTTAQRAIEKLELLGILSPVSEAKRGRVYCARQLLAILEEPTKIGENFE